MSVQDDWIDAAIAHQIGVMRFAAGLGRRVNRLLDATESDLRTAIRRRLRLAQGLERPSDVARLQALLADVREIRTPAWREVHARWRAELTGLAMAEPRINAATLKDLVPVQLDVSLPEAGRLRAIVTAKPFEGKVLSQWAANAGRADVDRISSQIRIGLVQGEDVPQITRRVVGSVSKRGSDGATELSRRDAESITRTAANHVANQARQELWKENADIVTQELYLATLDSKTTPACRGFDGQVFPLGTGPVPPIHFRCRSLRQALLDEEAIGVRPMKPVTERGLLREFTRANGLAATTTRDGLPRGVRGEFDDFARRRTRELIGTVPARTSYGEFLRRQSAEFVDDVLGPARGRLFRAGGLELRQFTDREGGELTLRELVRRHRSAFTRAGLDPDAF